jgi:hypothetical protein
MTVSPRFLWMLDHARKEQMCMDPFCGTCGATPFMKRVERTLGLEEFVPWQTFFRRRRYRDLLLNQLASLNPDQAEANFHALKFSLTRAFSANPPEVQLDIENRLRDTSAGLILVRMKKHHEDRMAKRALSDPELAKARREEKKKMKAEIHQKRVEFYRANPFLSDLGPIGHDINK